MKQVPNVIFVFADQWRAGAAGYNGDPNVHTPNIDRLSREAVNFSAATAACPICTPSRATMITGQYPLTSGMFMNDLSFARTGNELGHVFSRGGYDTAYIGKWHIDGHGREAYIPRQRRCGFDYWKVLECTHDYLHSHYYAGDDPTLRTWEGYDAYAQTADAISYLRSRQGKDKPFFLMLSYGTPHNPYDQVPRELLELYREQDLKLSPNVPPQRQELARKDLRGYYAHITGIDRCVGKLEEAMAECDLTKDTILVLTSDHGDCVQSHCDVFSNNKQVYYDESVHVPFLLRDPRVKPGEIDTPFDTADIFPTLADLCGLPVPETCEGKSFAPALLKGETVNQEAVLIASYSPFCDWCPSRGGGEYRGLRTRRHTYVERLDGVVLLFDNVHDPWQQHNLAGTPEGAALEQKLHAMLWAELNRRGDRFLPRERLWEEYGYEVAESQTEEGYIPYQKTQAWKKRANGAAHWKDSPEKPYVL